MGAGEDEIMEGCDAEEEIKFYDLRTETKIRCKKYPAICNRQTGHSGRYCGIEKCEYQKKVKEFI
jgi:hypothetical protein